MEFQEGFDAWVSWVFDHPVGDPAWHWALDAVEMPLVPSTLAEYVTLLFQNPNLYLDRFSDDQLSQGFWFLVSGSCSSQMEIWFDEAVDWQIRRSGIAATESLFRRIFAERGSLHFTPDSQSPPLDIAGYMWWDVMPASSSAPNTDASRVRGECIDVMARILSVESPVCRYSALHGLGHWQEYDEKRARKVIDTFLANGSCSDQAILKYARDAREGNIQ